MLLIKFSFELFVSSRISFSSTESSASCLTEEQSYQDFYCGKGGEHFLPLCYFKNAAPGSLNQNQVQAAVQSSVQKPITLISPTPEGETGADVGQM